MVLEDFTHCLGNVWNFDIKLKFDYRLNSYHLYMEWLA